MVAKQHRADGGRANGLYWVVCHTCAAQPDETYADSHEVLTRDLPYATLVYGEHAARGHRVSSLDLS